jgi:DNA-directed RNA polymerase subunit RPC12/RpoP
MKINGDITTFISKCTKCGYEDTDVSDHGKFRQEQEAKEKRDKELLEKYRSECCLSDKEGQEYIEIAEAIQVAAVVREEEKQKYDNPVYQRSLQLKKTSVVDIERLLTDNFEKAKYTKLVFDKPEIGQYVIIPFTVQDADPSRKDRVSSSELEKIIKTTLEDTNWRLLSNSIIYRLGYLQGQLRGYEQQEDMLKLAGKKEGPKPKPKIDEEKRQKYATNNLVQLSKLLGKHDGIENVRKRRLEKEPDGFFLNDGGVGYTCGICSAIIPGEKTWWDLRGIRCPDCQRNLKEGVVPLEIFEDDYGYDVVIKNWSFRDNYGVHPSSVKKLRREGLLHGRDLKHADGTVYYTIYLVSENQEFLKKYPKKDEKMRMTIADADGKPIEL